MENADSVPGRTQRKGKRMAFRACEMEILYSLCIFCGLLGIGWGFVFVFVTYTRLFFDFQSDTTLDDIFAMVYHSLILLGTLVLPMVIRYCMLPHLRPGAYTRILIAVIFGLLNQGYVAVCAARATLTFRDLEHWNCAIAWDYKECEVRMSYYQFRFILDTIGAAIGAFCTILLPATYMAMQSEDDKKLDISAGSQEVSSGCSTYTLPPPPNTISVPGPAAPATNQSSETTQRALGSLEKARAENPSRVPPNGRVWIAIPGGGLTNPKQDRSQTVRPVILSGTNADVKGRERPRSFPERPVKSRGRVGSTDSDAYLISGSNSDESEEVSDVRHFTPNREKRFVKMRRAEQEMRDRVNSTDSETCLMSGTGSDIQDKCPVCMDFGTAVMLNCGHSFCHSCVGPFARSESCPSCGTLITERRLIDQSSVF